MQSLKQEALVNSRSQYQTGHVRLDMMQVGVAGLDACGWTRATVRMGLDDASGSGGARHVGLNNGGPHTDERYFKGEPRCPLPTQSGGGRASLGCWKPPASGGNECVGNNSSSSSSCLQTCKY